MLVGALKGRAGGAAGRLWVEIARNCHRLARSAELDRAYWGRLREFRDTPQFPDLSPIISAVLTNSNKSEWVVDMSALAEEVYVHHAKDQYLLRIAARTGGNLVTTDSGTRDDFNKPEIANKFGISGLTIEEALSLASQRNGGTLHHESA